MSQLFWKVVVISFTWLPKKNFSLLNSENYTNFNMPIIFRQIKVKNVFLWVSVSHVYQNSDIFEIHLKPLTKLHPYVWSYPSFEHQDQELQQQQQKLEPHLFSPHIRFSLRFRKLSHQDKSTQIYSVNFDMHLWLALATPCPRSFFSSLLISIQL